MKIIIPSSSISDHQNWFGVDEHLGAVAVSIRREKVPLSSANGGLPGSETFIQPRNIDPDKEYGKDQWMYRLLVRTCDLLPLRGCVLEESIPALRSEKIKSLPTKEVLEFVCPELQLSRYDTLHFFYLKKKKNCYVTVVNRLSIL